MLNHPGQDFERFFTDWLRVRNRNGLAAKMACSPFPPGELNHSLEAGTDERSKNGSCALLDLECSRFPKFRSQPVERIQRHGNPFLWLELDHISNDRPRMVLIRADDLGPRLRLSEFPKKVKLRVAVLTMVIGNRLKQRGYLFAHVIMRIVARKRSEECVSFTFRCRIQGDGVSRKLQALGWQVDAKAAPVADYLGPLIKIGRLETTTLRREHR